MTDAALALADCQAKGLIRHVGTTNMDTAALDAIVSAGVPVVVNQVGRACVWASGAAAGDGGCGILAGGGGRAVRGDCKVTTLEDCKGGL